MKKQLLFAEDDRVLSKIYRKIFKDEFDVITFNNGEEALEWLRKGNSPDLIITDINMPRTNGWMLLSYVKGSYDYHKIPVLMLTGLTTTNIYSKAINLGASDFLEKPFFPKDLKVKVKTLVSPFMA